MPRHICLSLVCTLVLSAFAAGAAHGERPVPDFAAIAKSENDANAQPGPRTTPAKVIPVPDDVSPEMQAVIANPFRANFWGVDPKSPEEWKTYVAYWAGISTPPLAGIREATLQETTIDDVHAYILQPKTIPAVNANRLLVHVHGGGYTNSPGEAALMAGYGGFKVISVDYRMPPDHPYPAALDDAMTNGRLEHAAALYANGHDLKDPMLSPI